MGTWWSDAIRRRHLYAEEFRSVIALGAIGHSKTPHFFNPDALRKQHPTIRVGHDPMPLVGKRPHRGAKFCARIVAMRVFWGLLLLHTMIGCSTTPAPTEDPGVSVESTLEHIRQSYILGCSEALRGEGKKDYYPNCRDKGIKHSDAVRKILEPPTEVK
jgi:hypothetical protein